MDLGYLEGFGLKYFSGTIVDLDPGMARDADDMMDIVWLSTGLSVDFGINGGGGLDTGVKAADNWYAIYVIGNSSTGGATAIASLSFSGPTVMPAGYDVYRRVGAVYNNQFDAINRFFQVGASRRRWTYYDQNSFVLQALSGGNDTSYAGSDVSLAAQIPPTARIAQLLCEFNNSAGAAGDQFSLRPKGAAAGTSPLELSAGVLTSAMRWLIEMPVVQNQTIQYQVDSASDALSIWVTGFEDEL